MSKKVLFKQIAPIGDQVVCLDVEGSIWIYDGEWSHIESPTPRMGKTLDKKTTQTEQDLEVLEEVQAVSQSAHNVLEELPSAFEMYKKHKGI